ncbi:zinc-dependent metalloprotease [Gammaproteobacteria bacterium]|nr:zinc-dependent metalloprotease [Gammaproteobacteria bacterium]
MKSIQFLILILIFTTTNIFALEKLEDKNNVMKESQSMGSDDNEENSEEDEPKTIESFIEENGLEEIDGFMHIWVDKEKEDYFLQLNIADLNEEFIYFTYILDAPQASGNFGGALSDGSILEFRKFKKDIGLYKKNTRFIYDQASKISQSKLRNIQEAFIGRFKVEVHEEETSNYLIKVNSLFLSEMLTAISPNIPPEYMEYVDLNVGKIDKSKTFVDKIKNYTKNTTIDVVYGFFNPKPKNSPVDAVADKRYTFGKVRHLFVEMPDDNFEPRIADQRVGYFSEKVTDLSSYNYFPAVDLINKWRLIKKNPNAEISEPINPIIYWVENSTPEEIRPFVIEGIEAWNDAFEKAGFKNAVIAKIQPDDADWDAGDIQYNVVRWSSSPDPQFSGYGPSIANPKTGELIAADIVQEFNAIKYGYRLRKIWGYDEENDPLRQWIASLTMHEVGHTLGLRHNFKASWLYDANDIHDKSITGKAHISSVMDYDPINIAPKGVKQGNFFPHGAGFYDIWAIQFGYTPNLTESTRESLLSKSSQPEYKYGTDGDAMGSPGYGIDPRAKRYDMSSDPIEYSKQRLAILDSKILELPEIFGDDGSTYTELRATFASFLRERGRFFEGVSRLIGGVYSNRIVNGQQGKLTPYEAVAYEDQKRAMELITSELLSNDAFIFDPELLKLLQPEKRPAYNPNEDANDDPKLHDTVLGMQENILRHILSPSVMLRLSDSSKYGNKYSPVEVLEDLRNGIFVTQEIPNSFKRNLQSSYLDGLIGALNNDSYDDISKAAIYSSILEIEKFTKRPYGNLETKGHLKYLNWKINKALEI